MFGKCEGERKRSRKRDKRIEKNGKIIPQKRKDENGAQRDRNARIKEGGKRGKCKQESEISGMWSGLPKC